MRTKTILMLICMSSSFIACKTTGPNTSADKALQRPVVSKDQYKALIQDKTKLRVFCKGVLPGPKPQYNQAVEFAVIGPVNGNVLSKTATWDGYWSEANERTVDKSRCTLSTLPGGTLTAVTWTCQYDPNFQYGSFTQVRIIRGLGQFLNHNTAEVYVDSASKLDSSVEDRAKDIYDAIDKELVSKDLDLECGLIQ